MKLTFLICHSKVLAHRVASYILTYAYLYIHTDRRKLAYSSVGFHALVMVLPIFIGTCSAIRQPINFTGYLYSELK
jgi:hypothetical protein